MDPVERRLIPACAGKTQSRELAAFYRPAHPRVCGENHTWAPEALPNTGSSPRVRGKPFSLSFCGKTQGLIPACAGKTAPLPTTPNGVQAHPRVCGENQSLTLSNRLWKGSSPRVRGKPVISTLYTVTDGLIPACAGKTRFIICAPFALGAHPRVCGENPVPRSIWTAAGGSSPRVRGKLSIGFEPLEYTRLIPACAGKTAHKTGNAIVPGAHPRVCGENISRPRPARMGKGSSPRVRGKLHRPTRKGEAPGLIPACAGKTSGAWTGRNACTAHPRVCGENVLLALARCPAIGSSPRVRGKPVPRQSGKTTLRLIPACAGKTTPRIGGSSTPRAHPRVCGENLS